MKTSGKLSEFLNGAGFYIVLFLAIAIIGASGYFIYTTLFGDRESPDASSSGGNAIVSEQPEHQMPDVELHEDVTLPQSEPGPGNGFRVQHGSRRSPNRRGRFGGYAHCRPPLRRHTYPFQHGRAAL